MLAVFGTSKPATLTIAAFNGTIAAIDAASPFNAQAGIAFQNDGSITKTGPTPSGTDGIGSTWTPATGTPGTGIWVRATLSAGTNPTAGTMNTWQEITSARSYSNTRASLGITTSTILFEFATDSGGATVIGSRTCVIRAEGA